MHDKPVALVTGANKGIGRQIAKDLAGHGYTVLIGARNLQAGQAAAREIGANAQALHLDVTDQQSVLAAAAWIERTLGRLDVLVNNAGIAQAGEPGRSMQDVVQSGLLSVAALDELRAIFETNVFAVVAVTQAMLPLLSQAPAGRIVNLSSITGSLSLNAQPSNAMRQIAGIYSVSKTALNAVTQAFAIELENTPIKVNAVCPGFTATAINNFAGTGSLEDAAREPVRLALLGPDGPSGSFSNAQGPLAW